MAEYRLSYFEALQIPAQAAFYLAMLATVRRWRHVDDMRMAATFVHLKESDQKAWIGEASLMLAGPGRLLSTRETLSERARRAWDESEAELEAVYRDFEARGILLPAKGGSDIRSLLKRA